MSSGNMWSATGGMDNCCMNGNVNQLRRIRMQKMTGMKGKEATWKDLDGGMEESFIGKAKPKGPVFGPGGPTRSAPKRRAEEARPVSSWVESKDPVTGATYYFNPFTRQTQWERPADFYDERAAKRHATAVEVETAARRKDYSQALTVLYTAHAPEKLAPLLEKLPALLVKYKGKELALLGAVRKKYGVETPDVPDTDEILLHASDATKRKVNIVPYNSPAFLACKTQTTNPSWRSLANAVDPSARYFFQKFGDWRPYSKSACKSLEEGFAHGKERVSVDGGRFVDLRDHDKLVSRLASDPLTGSVQAVKREAGVKIGVDWRKTGAGVCK